MKVILESFVPSLQMVHHMCPATVWNIMPSYLLSLLDFIHFLLFPLCYLAWIYKPPRVASHLIQNPCSWNSYKEDYRKLPTVSSGIDTFNPNSKLLIFCFFRFFSFFNWKNSWVFLLLLALGNRQNLFSSLKELLVCCTSNWIMQSKISWMLHVFYC